jgi:hypothetical protein
MGIFNTKVWNSMRSVATPIAAIAVSGSMNGLFSRNSRVPSKLYGYFDDDSRGYAMLSGTAMLSNPASSAARASGT